LIAWLLGSRLGRVLGLAGAALAGLLAFTIHQRRDAVKGDRHKAREADNENANNIRNTVERDLPDRVRQFENQGWRD
jgi:hypothetical protein